MNTPTPPESRLVAREQEQSVLGGLLLDNDAIDRIGDLRVEHFHDSAHRAIFRAILQLITANKPADVITVWERLQSNGSDAADLEYLNALAQNTPSSANVRHYAETVRDRAIKRGLVALCREIAELVPSSPDNAASLVDVISSRLEALAQATVRCEPELAVDSLAAHIETLDAVYGGQVPLAISTGFPDLDKRLNGGLRRGNLIVLAGRPKMGKTAKALNIANAVAIEGVAGVLSMEMSLAQLHDRNLSSIGQIHLDHVTDPTQMTDDDWPRLTHAVQKISSMRLYIDVQPGLSLMQVRAKAKQIKRRAGGLDVLVIDYLQLMTGDGDNRNAQIEGITRGLKNLAKELDIAIILLSQLNRQLETRPNKRPQPSDLRDSGSIEQDADVVIFLYRDEVYNPDSPDKGICEVNVALNRQGAAGVVPLVYIGAQTRFETLQRSWHPAPPKSAPVRSRGFKDDE
jgi:replicative DNA helicase